MEPDLSNIPPPKSLWMHVRKVVGDMNRSRPASAYLLVAIAVVLLLGYQIVYFREDPRRFAFFLILMFVFFFFVMLRAVIDFFEIARKHIRERGELFKTTIGEKEFIGELGRRVSENRTEE
ncbi:MAG: hypothetical protein K1Y02_24545 [Candidatus Hydrogenedentes bacterium]|nr:hypothetical protein [Candidatus Hydrogenedentota bacterium]